uniref:Uncharacterized protein LOC105109734 isoform X2 n=1 Tax=Rhizophora mucronata TaxID=61149 RepID=A0A2P2KM22_RHIMU
MLVPKLHLSPYTRVQKRLPEIREFCCLGVQLARGRIEVDLMAQVAFLWLVEVPILKSALMDVGSLREVTFQHPRKHASWKSKVLYPRRFSTSRGPLQQL